MHRFNIKLLKSVSIAFLLGGGLFFGLGVSAAYLGPQTITTKAVGSDLTVAEFNAVLDVSKRMFTDNTANPNLYLGPTTAPAQTGVGGSCPTGYDFYDFNENSEYDAGECWKGLTIVDGKVGIGISAPTEALDVVGNIKLSGNLVDTSVTAGISLGQATTGTALTGFTATSIVGALNELKTGFTTNADNIDTNAVNITDIYSTLSGNVTTLAGFSTQGIVQTDGSGAVSTSMNLPNGALATTQTAGDNSTKVATTAYVDGALGSFSSTFTGLTDTPSSYTAGSVLFTSGSAVTENNANFFWDDTNNRLGIGTITPGYPLHVKRNVGSSAAFVMEGDSVLTGAPKMIFRDTNGGNTDGIITFDVTNEFSIIGGNVGIGSATPGGKLVVVGEGLTNVTYGLNVTDSGGTSNLFVRDDGNVGIGTSVPNTTLDVVGQIVARQATNLSPTGTTQIIDFETGNAQVLDLSSATGDVTITLSNAYAGGSYLVKVVQGSTVRDLTWPATVKWPEGAGFALSSTANATDVVSLYYDGTNYLASVIRDFRTNASIASATASPLTTKGDLYTYSTTDARLGVGTNGQVLTADSAEPMGLKWADAVGGIGIGDTVTASTTGSILFSGASSVLAQDNANFFWDDTNNRLGIGNAIPAVALDVTGDVTSSGTMTAIAFSQGSDERLKENITPLANALLNVKKLQGVEFTWKKSGKDSVGLIAQEVEKIYPQLVDNNPDGFKSLQYANLSAVLIEAVKELDTKIEAQNETIDALRAEVIRLKMQ